MGPQLLELPERVAHRPARQQHDPSPAAGNGATDGGADEQEVVGLGGLGGADADPALGALQERQQVHRRVVDRQVLVVDRRHPRAGCGDLLTDELRQLGVARDVVGHLRHPARQLVGRVQAVATGLRGDDELDGRGPVGVEHDDRVGCQRGELLGLHPVQPGHEADLAPLVELAPHGVGQHHRRHVGDERGADDLPAGPLAISHVHRPPPRSAARRAAAWRAVGTRRRRARHDPCLTLVEAGEQARHQRVAGRRRRHPHEAAVGRRRGAGRRGRVARACQPRPSASPS